MRRLIAVAAITLMAAFAAPAQANVNFLFFDLSGLGSTYGDAGGAHMWCVYPGYEYEAYRLYPGQTVRLSGGNHWGFAVELKTAETHWHQPMGGGTHWNLVEASLTVVDTYWTDFSRIKVYRKNGPRGVYYRWENTHGTHAFIIRRNC